MSLKYLSKFWKTIEMSLIDCKINFNLTWPANYVISEVSRITTFVITDTKLYVFGCNFVNWNKNQSKATMQTQNQYLDYLIDPSLQAVNRHFVFFV